MKRICDQVMCEGGRFQRDALLRFSGSATTEAESIEFDRGTGVFRESLFWFHRMEKWNWIHLIFSLPRGIREACA